MDRGKRKVEWRSRAPNDEAERRQLKARRAYAVAAGQFWPLMGQIDRWIAQHRAPHQGQEEPNGSDVEDGASPTPVGEGLAGTLENILQMLEENREASGSRSGQVADPIPELPPADDPTPTPPEVPPTDLKPEVPLAEPKPEAFP